MESIRRYNLRIYGNKKKLQKLDELLSFWKNEVNKKIKIFWDFNNINSSYPPKEHTRGGRLVRDVSVKAWQIVKGAKRNNQKEKPVFRGDEIDLNESSGYLIEDLETKEFDIWFNVISLEKRKRLKLPCKKYRRFNQALEKGQLRRSFKIIKRKNDFYMQVFVEIPEKKSNNNRVVGLDVGLNHTVVASDGMFFGDELRDLRIRTKWRKYLGLSAFKQGLHGVGKQIVNDYPGCDFAVEQLLFKGKGKRSKKFRRRNSNWAYAHLAHYLGQMGYLEGFKVYYVDPAYSSQTCPVCGFVSSLNRLNGDGFRCGRCGFLGNADHVGALNLAERVRQEHPFLKAFCTAIGSQRMYGGV